MSHGELKITFFELYFIFGRKISFFQFILEAFAITILIASVNYWLLLPTLIMIAGAYTLRYFYVNTSRSVRRVESLSEFNAIIYFTILLLRGVARRGGNLLLFKIFFKLLIIFGIFYEFLTIKIF